MSLNTSGELWWGLTDIVLLLWAVVLGVILGTKKGDPRRIRSWQMVFFAFAAAALFGTLVHTFDISHGLQLAIWVVLYILLFEAGFLFNCRLLGFLTGGAHLTQKERTWLRIFELVLFVVTLVLHFALPSYEDALYVFLGYAITLLIPLIVLMLKEKSLFPILMMASLALSLASQALSAFFSFGVVLGHIFDMLALYFGYRTALADIR